MAETAPDPTPEQIAERCLEVQAGWSAAQRASRVAVPGWQPWLAPLWAECPDDGELVRW